MDPKLLALLSQLMSASSLEKMGQIEGMIAKYKFADGSTTELVPALCKFIMSNLDQKENAVFFVSHIIDASFAAGPELERLMADNADTILALIKQAEAKVGVNGDAK